MSKFNVYHYLTFSIRTDDVEAENPMDAVMKSMGAAWDTAHSTDSRLPNGINFSEEQTGALVDTVGDEEYLNSVSFDQKEIYNAEPCNERIGD